MLGLILNLVVLATSRTYFQAFTSNGEIFSLCIEYMRICAFIQIPNMVHIAIQKMLQAAGNMIAPMWFQIAGVIVNIVFDPLLIFGIGPFPKLGIAGAAIATVMRYAFSMVLALLLLFNGKQAVQIKSRMVQFDFRIIKNIFVCGFPSFIMNALSAFTVTFLGKCSGLCCVSSSNRLKCCSVSCLLILDICIVFGVISQLFWWSISPPADCFYRYAYPICGMYHRIRLKSIDLFHRHVIQKRKKYVYFITLCYRKPSALPDFLYQWNFTISIIFGEFRRMLNLYKLQKKLAEMSFCQVKDQRYNHNHRLSRWFVPAL